MYVNDLISTLPETACVILNSVNRASVSSLSALTEYETSFVPADVKTTDSLSARLNPMFDVAIRKVVAADAVTDSVMSSLTLVSP